MASTGCDDSPHRIMRKFQTFAATRRGQWFRRVTANCAADGPETPADGTLRKAWRRGVSVLGQHPHRPGPSPGFGGQPTNPDSPESIADPTAVLVPRPASAKPSQSSGLSPLTAPLNALRSIWQNFAEDDPQPPAVAADLSANSEAQRGAAGSPLSSATPDSSAAVSGPLTFDNFTQEFRAITGIDSFEGFKIDVNKSIDPHLQINQSVSLSSPRPHGGGGGYNLSLGPTYVAPDGATVLLARATNSGALTARGIHRLGGLETKVQGSGSVPGLLSSLLRRGNSQSASKGAQREGAADDGADISSEVAVDYTAAKSTSSARTVYQGGTWILNGAFTQMFCPRFQMGTELVWVSSNGASIGSLASRYVSGKNIFTAQWSRQPDFKSPGGLLKSVHGLKMQNVYNVSDRLRFATEVEATLSAPYDSVLRSGYEYSFRQARVGGLIDSGGVMQVSVMDNSGIGVSGTVDLLQEDYRVGVALAFNPS